MWKFLRDRRNREVISWIGGGATVVAAGAWAVFVFFWDRSPPEPRPQTTTSVEASGGGVAVVVGGNLTDSEINIGVPLNKVDELVRERTKPLEERTASQRETIDLLKQNLELTQGQIRAALEILGEKSVPPERLAAKLIEIAQQFKELRATAAPEPGDDAEIAALKQRAQVAIDAGDLKRADDLLAAILARQLAERDRLASNAAETHARRGEVALTGLDYDTAALHYAEAARTLPPGDDNIGRRLDYLLREADALYRQGDEFGDNGSLVTAVDRYRAILPLVRRERMPLQWAGTQNNFGAALQTLGERESGTARLEEAVAAYRAALTERTRERVPLQWAGTQNNLGTALRTLGERESGTARLEEAVAAYRAALEEYARERVPLDWVMSFGNQGVALMLLAERTGDAGMAEQAVDQIAAAHETMRDGGHAPNAAYYEERLPEARALLERLRRG